MHLHECHQSAAQACLRNANLLSALFRSPQPVQKDVLRWSEDSAQYVKDFQYLSDELERYAQGIVDLKETITFQLELFEKRRSRYVGIFIAAYVPLAFATVGRYLYRTRSRIY
jgi:hypothetical protein